MIERYFRAGVRYLWRKPNDATGGPQDGAIVPSTMVANNLMYDGLDGHRAVVDPLFLLTDVNAVLGLLIRANIPHTWLDYAPGRSAQVQIGGSDILTGFMSGCLIVRGTYGGLMSAFHVGTITGNPGGINQTVKRNFAQNLPADATGFEPDLAWTRGEISAIQAKFTYRNGAQDRIFALVTTAGAFYSILMFNVADPSNFSNPAGQSYWCVGGIKLVPPLSRVRLMAKLL